MRFADPAAARPRVRLEATPADLRIVRRHHRAFYAVLLAAPFEWLARGRPSGWATLAGVALFAVGLWGYRRAGGALGDQLSPLVAPREPVCVITQGPYRRLRHPMYRAEIAMAFGAPLVLNAWVTMVLAAGFTALVLRRIEIEEAVLLDRVPEYRAYTERTARLLPHVY